MTPAPANANDAARALAAIIAALRQSLNVSLPQPPYAQVKQ